MKIFVLFFISLLFFSAHNEVHESFIGEIHYKSYSTRTLISNQLDNSFNYVDHMLLEDKIEKYQIDNNWLTNHKYDFHEGRTPNFSVIQNGHVAKLYSRKSPDMSNRDSLAFIYENHVPTFISKKINIDKFEGMKRVQGEKSVLGMKCSKYIVNKSYDYNDKEFLIEYWINEDMKYDQSKYENEFNNIFTDYGLIMCEVAYLKPNLDTFSYRSVIKLNLIKSFKDESKFEINN